MREARRIKAKLVVSSKEDQPKPDQKTEEEKILDSNMFALLFDRVVAKSLDYFTTYHTTRDVCLKTVNELKLATGDYKADRAAYVAVTTTYTKSLYE